MLVKCLLSAKINAGDWSSDNIFLHDEPRDVFKPEREAFKIRSVECAQGQLPFSGLLSGIRALAQMLSNS